MSETKDLDHSARYHAMVLEDLHSVFAPHEGQIPIGRALFHDGKKRIGIECGRKFGKQIYLDEEILTPNGFVRYGDLCVGDTIYDEMGKEQKVTFLSEINYSPESYRITFCNGQTIDACAEHRWLTHTKLDRKSLRRFPETSTRHPTIKTTREIAETLMHGKEYNHSIPYAKPIEMKEKEQTIDPYILGCWLGDGGQHGAGFTNIDKEIVDIIKSKYEVTFDGVNQYYIKGIVGRLKELNLIKNKHIPNNYLFGSIEQRLSLLQGLMDTDGTIDKLGRLCCFDNTNKMLADGVFFLVASLGMKPSMNSRVGKLYGVEKKLCYRVTFKPLINVFRLTRKTERITPSKKSEHHTIVNVERIESKPMRCISVSGDSHLYLIGRSLIPTHNTEMLIYCLYRWCLLFPNSWSFYIAPIKDQINDLVWANGRLPYFLPEALMKKYGITVKASEFRVVFGNGSYIRCDGSDSYEKGRGYSATGLVVYDEYKDHNPKFHDGFEPNLAITDAPLMAIGTPPTEADDSFKMWENMMDITCANSPVGYYLNAPSWTNPHISMEFFKRKHAELLAIGEEWKWQQEYEAKRVRAGSRSIFPMLNKKQHQWAYADVEKFIKLRPKDWEFYGAFDPASASVFGGIFIAVHRLHRMIFVLDEIYADKMEDARVDVIVPKALNVMESWAPIEDWFCVYDYAATWFLNEVQAKYDMALSPCEKDLKNKENKLSLIRDILSKELLIFSDKCVKAWWEFSRYATDDKGKIPKKDDHLIDSFRYAINAAHYTDVPIAPIKKQDLLFNPRLANRQQVEDNSDKLRSGDDVYADVTYDFLDSSFDY